MKQILISTLFLVLALNSEAQSWDAKLENAQFETSRNNYLAYFTTVTKTQGLFTDEDFDLITNRCVTKEGIFQLQLSDDKSTITVHFLEWIDPWTINWLFTEANPDLNKKLKIQEKTVFTF